MINSSTIQYSEQFHWRFFIFQENVTEFYLVIFSTELFFEGSEFQTCDQLADNLYQNLDALVEVS